MSKENPHISIVSPVYRAEAIIQELVSQISFEMNQSELDYELILVNDASPDNSWQIIKQICSKSPDIIGVNLSRNFGQHYAISAGLSIAKGEWIVVMDCDLQDRPDEIVNLLNKAKEGFLIVQAKRLERKDSVFKKLSSTIFHSLYSYLSGIKTDKTIANFGIYHSKVISEYNKLKEQSRSFPSLIHFLGYNRTYLNVKHSERHEGKSSYAISKLLRLSLDVTLSNSNKPLRLAVKFGFIISFTSIFLAFYNLLAYFFGIISLPKFTSTIFSIWFVGGLNIFALGVVGLYIGKIYDDVKGRPIFVIEEILNNKK
jgi:dolichol-phosphate mannosyltransferase